MGYAYTPEALCHSECLFMNQILVDKESTDREEEAHAVDY